MDSVGIAGTYELIEADDDFGFGHEYNGAPVLWRVPDYLTGFGRKLERVQTHRYRTRTVINPTCVSPGSKRVRLHVDVFPDEHGIFFL